MSTKNHHIDELFARELGNIEIEPPPSVWQDIEKKLNKKKRIGLLYFRIGLAAGFALLFSVSGIYWYNHSSEKNTVLVASKIKNSEILTPDPLNTNNNNNNNTAKVFASTNHTMNISKVHSADKKSLTPSVIKTDEAIENNIMNSDLRLSTTENYLNASTNGQEDAQEYLVPKPGIIALKKPELNPKIVETPKELQPDVQLASNEPEVKINRWSIEAQFAPTYSYRNITSSSALNADFNKNESGLVSYANAIKVNYQTSKRLTIQAGIAYSVIGQTLRNIYIQQPANDVGLKYSSSNVSTYSRVNTSFGLINNNADQAQSKPKPSYSLQYAFFNTIGTEKMSDYGSQNAIVTTRSDADIIKRMQVIEIPIIARYYIKVGKFNWHVTGGLSTNILIGNVALLRNNNQNEKIGETDNLKPLNYSAILGTGLGYAIKRNVIFTLEPTFKYYLNSISTTDIKVHPYSFGIYTGVCYKL